MIRFNTVEGWEKIGRRHHYFRDDLSLCEAVRIEHSKYTRFEIDPDPKPLPDDCAECWAKLRP